MHLHTKGQTVRHKATSTKEEPECRALKKKKKKDSSNGLRSSTGAMTIAFGLGAWSNELHTQNTKSSNAKRRNITVREMKNATRWQGEEKLLRTRFSN